MCKNKVLILGFGVTGKSANEFFLKNGFETVIWDEQQNKNPFNEGFDFKSICKVIKSPGIKQDHEIIKLLQEKGLKIYTDVDIFFDTHKQSKIIGITGTDGKSTISYFVFKLMEMFGYKVVLGGNFGYPLLGLPSAEYYVLELSSYQLESMESNHNFEISCITNIAHDHIDYHGSIELYAKAKERIIKNAKYKIFGDLSCLQYIKKSNDTIICNGDNKVIITEICKLLNIDEEFINHNISKIPPLEHRIEIVLNKNGVIIVNDSKATNLHSMLYALSKFEKNIILILGGKTKGEDFSILSRYKEKIKKIYLIGESENKFFNEIKEINCIKASTLDKVIKNITLEKDDILLFSPACASFDQFLNYEHRGKEFKRLINERFC